MSAATADDQAETTEEQTLEFKIEQSYADGKIDIEIQLTGPHFVEVDEQALSTKLHDAADEPLKSTTKSLTNLANSRSEPTARQLEAKHRIKSNAGYKAKIVTKLNGTRVGDRVLSTVALQRDIVPALSPILTEAILDCESNPPGFDLGAGIGPLLNG